MALDRSKVSEGPANERMVRRLRKGGWAFFAKTKEEWRSYFLDGEDGLIEEEAVARELFSTALGAHECQGGLLVRIVPVDKFARGPKEWSPRKG